MDYSFEITYEPLWKTMKKKGISTYQLINKYDFNKGTLYRLKQGNNVNISTLAYLCKILDCSIEDVVKINYTG